MNDDDPTQTSDAEVLDRLAQLNEARQAARGKAPDTDTWKRLDREHGEHWIWLTARRVSIYLHKDGVWRLYQ